MTLLWVLIGLISLIVCAVIFRTLVQKKDIAPLDRAECDVTVYKDQLSELERDSQRGILSADLAAAARTEIERRSLTLADVADATTEKNEGPKPSALSPLTIGLSLFAPSAASAASSRQGCPLPCVGHAGGAHVPPRHHSQRYL